MGGLYSNAFDFDMPITNNSSIAPKHLSVLLILLLWHCVLLCAFPVAVWCFPFSLALSAAVGLVAASTSICQSLARTTLNFSAPRHRGYLSDWIVSPLILGMHCIRYVYAIPSFFLMRFWILSFILVGFLYFSILVPLIPLFDLLISFVQAYRPRFKVAFNLKIMHVDSVITCMFQMMKKLLSMAIGFLASAYWYMITSRFLFTTADNHQIYVMWCLVKSKMGEILFAKVFNTRMADIYTDWAAITFIKSTSVATSLWRLSQLPFAAFTTDILHLHLSLIHFGIELMIEPFSTAMDDLYNQSLSEAKLSNNPVYQSPPHLAQRDGNMRVRLLNLQPGSGNEPVVCTLGTMDLERPDGKSYEAISYVWGKSPWTSCIMINGRDFIISTVLHQLLIHLRRESTPRILWIDALCVNQFDLAERSSQVSLMPKIYSNATQVIVWLSHDEPWGLQNTFQYINSLYQDGIRNERLNEGIHYGTRRVAAQLLRNEYWARVWVIQEVVLAKQVIVQCGNSLLAWDRFCCLIYASARRSFFPARSTYLEKFEDLNGFRQSRLSPGDKSKAAPRKFRPRGGTNLQLDDPAMDLLSLCYSFRFRKSTEPRDKVFAFLGLSNHSENLLNADYSRRESFLSIEISTQHVCYSRSLAIVALAESMRPQSRQNRPVGYNPDYIPTWCPFFFDGSGQFDKSLHLFWTGLPGENKSFSATGHAPTLVTPTRSQFQWEALSDHSLFHSLRVHVLSNFSTKITHDSRAHDKKGEAFNQILRFDELLYATLCSMTGPAMPAERALSEDSFRLRRSSRASCKSYTQASFDPSLSAHDLLHLTLTAGKFSTYPTSDFAASQKYHEARREACSQRRLFVTSNGHLGLGPESLKKGDELHLVLGMDVPVILRPASEEWRRLGKPYKFGWVYIGQAYVHEMMSYEGDLVADIDCGRVKIEERVLV